MEADCGEHTKEPWRGRIGVSSTITCIIRFASFATLRQTRQAALKRTKANAARIVACVNALAGIPTDKLAAHVAAVAARLREAAENESSQRATSPRRVDAAEQLRLPDQ